MVDEKKKKNKKKKNKLDKSTIANTNSAPENSQVENEVPKINEDFDNRSSTRGVGGSADVDQNHASVQGNLNHVSNSTQFENDMAKTDVEMDLGNQLSNGGEGMILEETVDTSPRGNDPPTEQQTSFESKLLQLEEKDSWLLKQDGLDGKIKELQEDNEIHLHKEATLEWKLLHIEKEIDNGIHKQAYLEEKFNDLVERTDSLSSKESSLEKKVKQLEMERDSWLEKENSTKETTAKLGGNFSRLQKQVMELEESKKYLLNENHRLEETISGLQFQIQKLEEHVASAVSSIEMRKINDLCIKPDIQGIPNNNFQDTASEPTVQISDQFGNVDSTSKYININSAFTDKTDFTKDILVQDEKKIADDGTESSENASLLVKTIEAFEDVAIQSEGEDHKNIRTKGNIVISNPSYTNGTNEIVQIPFDENHVMGPAMQPQSYEEKTDVPLSDSPLIGAPFRIVSFFARYVSGADLVNKS